MKTTVTYEKGDKVRVTATEEFGLCHSNSVGGTESFQTGKQISVTVKKTWWDGEIGRRYIGKDSTGQEFYFGEFGVRIEPI